MNKKKTKITTRVCGEQTSQRNLEAEERVPLVPRMMWMLCPAVILAWTSVVLLVPGISRSEENANESTVYHNISRQKEMEGQFKYQW